MKSQKRGKTKVISSNLMVYQLIPNICTKEELRAICQLHAPQIQGTFIEDKTAFLWALSGQESSFGAENFPKHEDNYGPGGILFEKSKLLKYLYYDVGYGAFISMSYSPWQIMAINAIEGQNFLGHPAELHDPQLAVVYVVGHLNTLITKGAASVDRLYACWNRGAGALTNPRIWPQKYVLSVMKIYNDTLLANKNAPNKLT